MYKFHSNLIKTDVTSVRISEKFIFAGIGAYLHIFNKETNHLTNKLEIFNGETIQGIIINKSETTLLIHGRNLINAYSIIENDIKLLCGKATSDWILAAKWIENETEIITISAHNQISLWDQKFSLIKTIKCEEKCILYCAFLAYDAWNDLIVLSGTVFSEILLWKPSKCTTNNIAPVITTLKAHKGVLFSIHYNNESNLICSTSDDRSAILWTIAHGTLSKELEQPHPQITTKCQVFGHLSRVFRCLVLNNGNFVTGGEDSYVNVWDICGKLIRKLEVHHGAPVWALDSFEKDRLIVSGGGDCCVSCFKLAEQSNEEKLVLPQGETPKKVAFLKGNDIVAISDENAVLFYYNNGNKKWLNVCMFDDLRKYALLEVSLCKNLVALAGFSGQIYIYRKTNKGLEKFLTYTTETQTRIFSFHWLSCLYFLTCEGEGRLTLYSIDNTTTNTLIKQLCKFVLPTCKEPWSTTACLGPCGSIFVGDRKGNLHLFKLSQTYPVQTVKKAHNYLGITKLHFNFENNELTSLGRNSVIVKHDFDSFHFVLSTLSSDKTPIAWLASILTSLELLLSFSGNNFVLWNYRTRRTIFKHDCGGGHRSWDFNFYKNDISFVYVKDKTINLITSDWKSLQCTDLLENYHNYEINALKTLRIDDERLFLISGGEDTTLRLSLVRRSDFKSVSTLKSHLSSVRTISTVLLTKNNNCDHEGENYLICSAGGRAQLVIWKLTIHPQTERGVICKRQFSFYENLSSDDDDGSSETRIMDVKFIKICNELALFAVSSDGHIKIFKVTLPTYELISVRNIFYKRACLIKIINFEVLERTKLIVTTATDGRLVFWDSQALFEGTTETFLSTFQLHQSGINSCDFNLIANDLCAFLTGGDDNAIILSIFRFKKQNYVTQLICNRCDVKTHCTQITGVKLYDNLFLTAGIDQRVTVFSWEFNINNNGEVSLSCQLVGLYVSTVADIQGMCCLKRNDCNDDLDVIVYGRGLEYLNVQKSI